MTTDFRTYNVLFVSQRNAARSILAEALLNRLGAGRFEAWSAGYRPAAAISPHALSLLGRIGYNTGRLSTKALTAVTGDQDPGFDFIIRLSPERRSAARQPVFKGKPTIIDWPLDDPRGGGVAAAGSAHATLFSTLAGRIERFANLSDAALMGGDIHARLERMAWDNLKLAS